MSNGSTPVTRSVRQILMNELGLTKESVRQAVRDIVLPVAESLIRDLISRGHFDHLVSKALERHVREILPHKVTVQLGAITIRTDTEPPLTNEQVAEIHES